MSEQPCQWIHTLDQLREFCRQVSPAQRIGLDTEFIGESSFEPRLELIQVATEGACAVIDVPALGSLDSLGTLLHDRTVMKVVHAGRQDIDLLQGRIGGLLQPIFDTQVAAALLGYGAQIGYAALVQRVLGKKLEKSHTLTNWSHRPLSSEQIAYAAEDVQFLLPLHDHLVGGLSKRGRLTWAFEECARLLQKPNDELRDPRRRYQRIRGWANLKPRAAAVLRELAAWREEEARHRNLPRGRIIRDDLLLELARRQPRNVEEFRSMRALSQTVVARYAETIMKLINTGLAVPKADHPEIPKSQTPEPENAGRIDLLQALLKACAHKAEIAPTLIATSADLQALIEAKDDRDQLDLPLLQGWRREVAGDLLVKMLKGNVLVGMDPNTGRVSVRDAT